MDVAPVWSVHAGKDHFLVSMRKGNPLAVAYDGTTLQREEKGHRGQVRGK